MSQKFSDTEVKNIGTILSDGKFKVPFSQRNYSWHTDKKDDQVGRLWSDLLSNFGIYRRNEERINELSEKENDSSLSSEEREHARIQKDRLKLSGIGEYFLGPMVFVKTDLNRYHGRYAIVDGQQRLTTITMVFCIIRDFMIKYSIQLENNPKTQLPNGFNDYAEFIENRITSVSDDLKLRTAKRLGFVFQNNNDEI